MPLVEAGIRSNGNSGAGAAALRTRGHAPNAAVVANAPSNCRRVINGVPSFLEMLNKGSRLSVIAHFLPSVRASAPIVDVWQIPCRLVLFGRFGSAPPPGYSALTGCLPAAERRPARA